MSSQKQFNSRSSGASQAALPSLVEAIDSGKAYITIVKLLEAGANPNETDKAGRTPMDAAMDREWYQTADLLMRAGAKPPKCDGPPDGPIPYDGLMTERRAEMERETALTYCLKHGNWYKPLYSYIANGADVNKANQAGETPLALAIARPWPYVATQLVKAGAWRNPAHPDPNEVVDDLTGATRLLAVILEGGPPRAVENVLKEGADPDKPDSTGLTPVAAARLLGWKYVEDMLVAAGADPNVSLPDPNRNVDARNSMPALSYAVHGQGCHVNYTAALLAAGADPNRTDPEGKAPAHWAAVYGKTDIFYMLQSHGADIMKPDAKHGATPLQYACMNGNYDIAARILETCPAEAITQAYGKSCQTLLHMAAARDGAADLVQLLIDKGADVNAKDEKGYTPLHEATDRNDLESVRVLLENGADTDKANEGKKYNPPLFHLCNSGRDKKNNAEIARLLLDAGASPSVRATESINGPHAGDSLLYFAVSYHALDVARELLKAGADPHDTSHIGATAMHHCLQLRQIEGVKLLLEFGFDPLRQFDFTETWHGGHTTNKRYAGSAYDEAKALAKQFGHDSKYGAMLDIIEDHLMNAAPAAPKPPPKAKPTP